MRMRGIKGKGMRIRGRIDEDEKDNG